MPLVATGGRGPTDASFAVAPAPVPASTTTSSPRGPANSTPTVVPAVVPDVGPPPAAPLPPPRSPPAVTTGCADALAYLASHQAPGFVAGCGSGSALGHYGYTCWNTAVVCPSGGKLIHIACPAPFVYMNEAHNSWSLQGLRAGIDPYGQGSAAEQAFCDALR
jgi:hypothetical protein